MKKYNKEEISSFKNELIALLEDNKAKDIITIDLENKSDVYNYMIIASGTSNRNVTAIAEKISDQLKHSYKISYIAEGLSDGQWVLIDTSFIAIHIFLPEIREYYNLEELWQTPNKRDI